jgi:mRNA-degrading endonuclease RelE of RelBE toxin-antitoxin system
MKRIEVSDQVRRFIRSLAPEPRKRLRAALRDLGRDRGNIKHLEGPLKEYFRLSVRDYRIIFQYSPKRKVIECVFVERRDLIYEIFEKQIHARLLSRPEE